MENQKDKKEYELGFLVKDESVAGAVLELVRSAGGDITTQGPVSRIPLAYEVQKEKEALFGFLQFALSPDKVQPLTSALELEKGLLRHLLVTPPPMKQSSPREFRPPDFADRRREKTFAARPVEQKPAALSNEALEKKIEEILK